MHSEYYTVKQKLMNIILAAEKEYLLHQQNKEFTEFTCVCPICMAVEDYHKAAMKSHVKDKE